MIRGVQQPIIRVEVYISCICSFESFLMEYSSSFSFCVFCHWFLLWASIERPKIQQKLGSMNEAAVNVLYIADIYFHKGNVLPKAALDAVII